MNKNKLILFSACIVTLLLGPGTGHLIMKEWRRAVLFITIALVLFLILASTFVSAVGHENLEAVAKFQNIEQFKNIYYKFQEDYPNKMLMFNILYAGLWAFTIVHLFKIAKIKGFFIKDNQ